MDLHKVYSGFLVKRIEKISEINGIAYELYHKQSGARLIYIDVDDTNKVFSISFRTSPKDSTGVAHIMEHSVLCGSRKFPLKEPFVELVKGSLNTFLNAMTYPDKTMYPVASKNDKDFHNLMDVYLDAVFYPRVAEDPEIVMQEGWHYEMKTPNDDLIYKGVVLNEMKGVFSSADSILERHMMETLFPDTTYGVESGGDPEVIPQLTYENFQKFYREYYHPSNSYIFLYGTMDIEAQLLFINDEYLSHFKAITVHSDIPLQAPFSEGKVCSFPYGIGSEDSEENKSMHALTYVLPEMNGEKSLAFEIITHALLTSPAAPLKKALVQAGIGSDVSGYYLDSLRQPIWNISITGSNMDQQKQVEMIVENTLRELVSAGLDKTMLEASLNNIEFSLREADFGGRPIGLAYNIRMMDNWLYDNDPIELLRYENILSTLRKGLSGTYFEDLITDAILQNTHKALVSIYPEKGLQEAKEAEEKEKLAAIKAKMTSDEIEHVIATTKKLHARQAEPDSPEALSSIPLLDLSDLSADIEDIERRESYVGGTKVHFIPTFAKGINYTGFYFKLDCLTENELFYADLLSDLLGRVDTTAMSYTDLANDINLNLGGFNADITAIGKENDRDKFVPLMIIRAKALHSKLSELTRIIHTILQESEFTNVERLHELISESKAIWDTEAFRRGNTIVTQRVLAQVSSISKFRDAGNLSYYQKISELVKQPDALSHLPEKLASIAQKLFRANNVEIMFVGEEHEFDSFVTLLEPMLATWNQDELPVGKLAMTQSFVNEGILTSGKVQYVGKGGNFKDHGFVHCGAMSVLETILRYEYLWIRVRVQGGAYGAFANFYENGNMIFCSYRDPNLMKTLDTYDELAEYLKTFTITDREMRKYIIGTMSGLDLPMTPALRGPRAMGLYFSETHLENKINFRKEVIACTQEDIRNLSQVVHAVMADNHICVMGNEQTIKETQELFDSLVPLQQ